MDQLERWIGKGPKVFTLLYAIRRDGCNAATFHQRCNNQGPTVIVLYNQQGSVYGGYASTSWTSNSGHVKTTDSFIFQLQYSGTSSLNKFDLKQSNYNQSIHCSSGDGPVFGVNDLYTFTGTINDAGGYFPLNGCMSLGISYDSRGITADKINNGTMNAVELEVYRVTDGQRKKKSVDPWRRTKNWDQNFLDELTEEIVSFQPNKDAEVSEARILMIGPVGSGKSSFYNTIDSVFRGRISYRARSGSSQHSLTTTYTPFTVHVRSGAKLNFRLCDTRGLEESFSISEVELNFLLEGNIPDHYQFNPFKPFSQRSPEFKPKPTLNDEIHCAVFVVDSTTLDVLPSNILDTMKKFQDIMNQKGIPQLLLLTKIDKLCKEVERDVSSAYNNEAIGKLVEKAAQLFGLPRLNVLPVKNYENEEDLDVNVNILALLALRKMLHATEDHFLNLIQHKKEIKSGIEKLTVNSSAKS